MIFRFGFPWVLLALAFVPLLWWWHSRSGRSAESAMRFSDVRYLRRIRPSARIRLRPMLSILRLAAITLFILALGRPQSGLVMEEVTSDGVDIMIALDVSGSMRALDFKPKNRLDMAKIVTEEFIKGRKNDRIGLVVFAGETYVQCPLTLDYGVLLNYLRDNVQILMGIYRVGMQEVPMIEDGTAIGMAIARSVQRLKDSPTKSKIIILVTDGANNAGEITPQYAAEIAQTLGIRVYTIGVGREEGAMQQVMDPLLGAFFTPGTGKSDLDVKTLQEVSLKTKGQFYLATDPKALEHAFQDIDKLEKTEIKVKEYEKFSELFVWFLGAGLIALALESLLANTFFRKIP